MMIKGQKRQKLFFFIIYKKILNIYFLIYILKNKKIIFYNLLLNCHFCHFVIFIL